MYNVFLKIKKWGNKVIDIVVLWIIIMIYVDVSDVNKIGESECNLIIWCVMWLNFFLLILFIRIMMGIIFIFIVLEKLLICVKSIFFIDKDL